MTVIELYEKLEELIRMGEADTSVVVYSQTGGTMDMDDVDLGSSSDTEVLLS